MPEANNTLMSMVRLGGRLLALASTLLTTGRAADLFATRIQPLLTERCIGCHGGGAKLSEFDLTTRASLLKGGLNGVNVIPGRAAESRLYQWVAAGKMPPDRRLEPEQVEAIREWIDAGAGWGAVESIVVARPRAGPDWWALQPPRKPEVPPIAGVENPIDRFLLQKLGAKGLDFAPPADDRTLRRRVHFDLIGLPPAPDSMNLSYAEQVERLLASPHYGERWGRHWLDVVRFGETDGGEHNNERFHAWRYRDYVIDAFNRDKPYNQFVLEQIAGDVLSPDDPRIAAATGFLLAGPWDSVTKRQNKDEVLRKTIRMDELDDMVTTTFATFQALTVNCARCHDHKFDPIPTRDYYRLTAVFNGAGFGERIIATPAERAAREAAVAGPERELRDVRQALARIEIPVRVPLLGAKYEAFDRERGQDPRRIPLNPIWNRNRFAPVIASRFRLAITGANGRARIERLELVPAGRTIENWVAARDPTPDQPAFLNIDLDQPQAISEIRWSTDRRTGANGGSIRIYRFEYSLDGETWRTACSSMDHVDFLEIGLPQVSEAELVAQLPPEVAARRRELIARRDVLDAGVSAVPELDTVYGVQPEPLTPSHVLERGTPATPGEAVTPGALSAVRTPSPELDCDLSN